MSVLVSAGRLAGWSVVASVAAVLTALELVIAVDLLATANFGGWQNWPVAVVYIALASVVAGRALSGRSSRGRAVLELVVLDLFALPVAVAVMAM